MTGQVCLHACWLGKQICPKTSKSDRCSTTLVHADAWCFTLRFPAVNKVAMAPFARLSASQQSTSQELFLLSR
jgi:hypothetical protein